MKDGMLVLCFRYKHVYICATSVHIGQRPHDEFNTMDTDMEKVLLPHDITSKVLVREILYQSQLSRKTDAAVTCSHISSREIRFTSNGAMQQQKSLKVGTTLKYLYLVYGTHCIKSYCKLLLCFMSLCKPCFNKG